MMLPSERDIVMRQEQYQDLLREAEHERLIREATGEQPSLWRWYRQIPGWIGLIVLWVGTQMVKWGLKLQGRHLTSPGEAGEPLWLNNL